MKTIPRAFYHIPVTVLFFTVVPIFYFLFVLMYNPFGSGELISAGVGYTLHLIITSLIVLGNGPFAHPPFSPPPGAGP